MTKRTRQRLETTVARLEAELPANVVEIAFGDLGVLTASMPPVFRDKVSRLRHVARQLANG